MDGIDAGIVANINKIFIFHIRNYYRKDIYFYIFIDLLLKFLK